MGVGWRAAGRAVARTHSKEARKQSKGPLILMGEGEQQAEGTRGSGSPNGGQEAKGTRGSGLPDRQQAEGTGG